jgi:hypothetical protein
MVWSAGGSLGAGWWRGLDSNQRTLARADLQSAAFNHSATSPRGSGRRAKWRRGFALSTRGTAKCRHPSAPLARSKIQSLPERSIFGAGEGNRTLVVSLEGFCSTIELHPLGAGAMPPGIRDRQLNWQDFERLDAGPPTPVSARSMANLNVIAATSAVHFWWRSTTRAARWRD